MCREARRERSIGRGGGRGSRDREVGEVWPFVTRPEEDFHQRPPWHLLIAPVRTCTRLACHLAFPSQGHPCTTAQPLLSPPKGSAPLMLSSLLRREFALLSLTISTSTGHSFFHHLPPLFPHFSESKTLQKELSVLAFLQFFSCSLLNSLTSRLHLHHSSRECFC